MDKTIKISLIVALLLGLLTYAIVNRYEIVASSNGQETYSSAYKLDKWTGEVRMYKFFPGSSGLLDGLSIKPVLKEWKVKDK